MTEQTERFRWITVATRIWLDAILVLTAVAIILTVAQGVFTLLDTQDWQAVTPYVLALLAELAIGIGAVMAYGVISLVASNERSAYDAAARLSRIESLLQDQSGSVRKLADLGCLSDKAKSLIYRDQEFDAFRESIHEDMVRQDYDHAAALINGIEKQLGYTEEAAKLKKELAATRQATLEEKIDAAIQRVQETIDRHDWARATREMRRILRLFPENPKVAALPERIEAARAKHKRGLLQSNDEAVRKNDIDRSIELLKQLDRYLTPQEADALQESVRGVFKAKLHNLGVQFAIKVTDQQWAQAVATGEEIVKKFPNTKMAQEVRQKLALLRSYASAASQQAGWRPPTES